MASIKVPANVSSMTFATSGVKAPTAQIISGITAAEATALVYDELSDWIFVTSAANGNVTLGFPPGILTSITINATPYVPDPTTGFISPVPPADATTFLSSTQGNLPFQLVTG